MNWLKVLSLVPCGDDLGTMALQWSSYGIGFGGVRDVAVERLKTRMMKKTKDAETLILGLEFCCSEGGEVEAISMVAQCEK